VEQRSSIHLGLTYLLIFDLFVQASFYVMANADADDVFQSTDEITRREIFFLANDFFIKKMNANMRVLYLTNERTVLHADARPF